jgi:YidC/Oxa1 family membrane protein insertase
LDNQRNFIFAIALCLALLLGFEFAMGKLYPAPPEAERAAAGATSAPQRADATHTREGGLSDPGELAE